VTGRRLDERLLKAIGHPLRFRLLVRLMEHAESPKRLAKELDAPLAAVAYHVRELVDLGCLELVDAVPRRGAIEHFYRAALPPFFGTEDWATLPAAARRDVSEVVLRDVWTDIMRAVRADEFDARTDRHLSRTLLSLDADGWTEINGMLDRVLERAMELQAQPPTAAEPIASSLVLMHFTRPGA
jgi:Helix-turn-helix domain